MEGWIETRQKDGIQLGDPPQAEAIHFQADPDSFTRSSVNSETHDQVEPFEKAHSQVAPLSPYFQKLPFHQERNSPFSFQSHPADENLHP